MKARTVALRRLVHTNENAVKVGKRAVGLAGHDAYARNRVHGKPATAPAHGIDLPVRATNMACLLLVDFYFFFLSLRNDFGGGQ